MRIQLEQGQALNLLAFCNNKRVASSFSDPGGSFPDGFHGHARMETAWEIRPYLWLWVKESWTIKSDHFDPCLVNETAHSFYYYLEFQKEEE